MLKRLVLVAGLGLSPFIASCASVGYVLDAIDGQISLLSKRRDVAGLLADPELSPELRTKLELSQRARDFATQVLHLPDNGSYRSYAELDRDYAVWNVIATEEFSVRARNWCFPVTGCVSYRGYFKREDAEAYAERLRTQGYDTYVAGALAYSTLGWFEDPVLSTMLRRSEPNLVGLLFHELAHQRLYVKGNSALNEAFATVVEREGVRRWFVAQQDAVGYATYLLAQQRTEAFFAMVNETRERLRVVYALPIAEDEKRIRKRAVLRGLADEQYRTYKAAWDDYSGFDAWMARELNNAHLALVATYNAWVPALQSLLESLDGDLPAFYDEVARIGALGPEAQNLRLASLRDWGERDGDTAKLSSKAGSDT